MTQLDRTPAQFGAEFSAFMQAVLREVVPPGRLIPDLIREHLVTDPASLPVLSRVDLALQLPLPDEEGRYRLLQLYARKLDLESVDLRVIAARSEGASPAFIKELLRKAALLAAGRARRPVGRAPDGHAGPSGSCPHGAGRRGAIVATAARDPATRRRPRGIAAFDVDAVRVRSARKSALEWRLVRPCAGNAPVPALCLIVTGR